jgi:excisionase family DNA binding protein
MRPLLTEEAADYIHCTVNTLRRYVREGYIPAYRPATGGEFSRLYFKTDDLDAFCFAEKVKGEAALIEEADAILASKTVAKRGAHRRRSTSAGVSA